jgi:Mannosylglycerate hydrolase MGH1-like glycoside hydrolase domain
VLWDQWLMRYRNTRGTGLVEGFCTYDTGHDNSPRWAGMPNQCPEKDAKICPSVPGLPRLCPDLSATVYGGRVALSAMARAQGLNADADRWAESAEQIRQLILAKLYVSEDAAFYDLDALGKFIKVRSDILSRVCGEHVVDQETFDSLWERQLHNPKAFWAPFPLPSIALDDSKFVRPIPRNSWGGASQALTALRASRWFEFYGKPAELSHLMDQWCEAIQRDMTFRQQIDPLTGEFTQEDMPNYSPAALVMMDFTWRLIGVREEQDYLEWNVRPGHAAAQGARIHLQLSKLQTAVMSYEKHGAVLRLNGRNIGRIDSGTVRLVTDKQGRPKFLTGISESVETISLRMKSHPARNITIRSNQQLKLD